MPPPKHFEVRRISPEHENVFLFYCWINPTATPRSRVFHATNITIVYHIIIRYASKKTANYNLISISTPAGKSKRIRASTVLGVGSRISISRL